MQAHVLPDPPDRAELTSQSFPGLYQGIPVPLCVQACGVNTVKVCVLGHIDDNYSYWKKKTFPFLCQWLSLWWLTCVENSSKHQRLLTWHTCTLCSANASWFATHLHPSYQVVEIILLSWYLFIYFLLFYALFLSSLPLSDSDFNHIFSIKSLEHTFISTVWKAIMLLIINIWPSLAYPVDRARFLVVVMCFWRQYKIICCNTFDSNLATETCNCLSWTFYQFRLWLLTPIVSMELGRIKTLCLYLICFYSIAYAFILRFFWWHTVLQMFCYFVRATCNISAAVYTCSQPLWLSIIDEDDSVAYLNPYIWPCKLYIICHRVTICKMVDGLINN